MSLLLLQEYPGHHNQINSWIFNHDQEHRAIIKAIFAKRGIRSTEYILEPFNTDDPAGWLARHQSAHNDFNALVNYNGTDLQDVDFKNDKERQAWSWFHWQEHININNALGIIT